MILQLLGGRAGSVAAPVEAVVIPPYSDRLALRVAPAREYQPLTVAPVEMVVTTSNAGGLVWNEATQTWVEATGTWDSPGSGGATTTSTPYRRALTVQPKRLIPQ